MLRIYVTRTTRTCESACAYALLRLAWSEHTALPFPPLQREAGGRPYFAGNPLYFSLSHSGGMACAAVSDGRVGVDLERVRPIRPMLVQRVLAPSEQRQLAAKPHEIDFFHFWTLKESYLKFTGEGIRGDLAELCFDLSGAMPQLAGSALCFRTRRIRGDAVLSVCTEKAEPTQWAQIPADALIF